MRQKQILPPSLPLSLSLSLSPTIAKVASSYYFLTNMPSPVVTNQNSIWIQHRNYKDNKQTTNKQTTNKQLE